MGQHFLASEYCYFEILKILHSAHIIDVNEGFLTDDAMFSIAGTTNSGSADEPLQQI